MKHVAYAKTREQTIHNNKKNNHDKLKFIIIDDSTIIESIYQIINKKHFSHCNFVIRK